MPGPIGFTDNELADLIAYLKTLSAVCLDRTRFTFEDYSGFADEGPA